MSFASPVDTATHGEYRIHRASGDTRPLYRFDGRVGSEEYPAEPGRYHLYAGWFCPWAQRVTAALAVAGIGEDLVSVSYVHGERDGRGWAFREPTGPDPVEGFTLLREAYEATEPGYDGHVSVPALWDRRTRRIVSNNFAHLDTDLPTAFAADDAVQLYPEELRGEIDDLERWLLPDLNQAPPAARADTAEGRSARTKLASTLAALDDRLAGAIFLVGNHITIADLRVIVTLLRFDAQANADGLLGPALDGYPSLWAWARRVYQHPGVRATTRFEAFTTPGATLPDWDLLA